MKLLVPFARTLLVPLTLAGFVSCSSTHVGGAHDADAQVSAAQFDKLKALAGTWVANVERDGHKMAVESRWRVTSAGNAVEETLFAGTDHEMVSMYHRDGSGLMMTHYCAVGNQPRMRATPRSAGEPLVFEYVDATNLGSSDDLHMSAAAFVVKPNGELQETWTASKNGKVDHSAEFTFTRKP